MVQWFDVPDIWLIQLWFIVMLAIAILGVLIGVFKIVTA